MARLYLWRHAKARWAEPGDRDFDRALKKSGRADAEAMATVMRDAGYAPELVLCSTARRTRETWDAAAPKFPGAEVVYLETLYSTDSAGYLEVVRQRGGDRDVMVVGHNPMTEDVAMALVQRKEADQLSNGFPTCGLAVLEFESDLSAIEPGTGTLVAFLTPRSLEED